MLHWSWSSCCPGLLALLAWLLLLLLGVQQSPHQARSLGWGEDLCRIPHCSCWDLEPFLGGCQQLGCGMPGARVLGDWPGGRGVGGGAPVGRGPAQRCSWSVQLAARQPMGRARARGAGPLCGGCVVVAPGAPQGLGLTIASETITCTRLLRRWAHCSCRRMPPGWRPGAAAAACTAGGSGSGPPGPGVGRGCAPAAVQQPPSSSLPARSFQLAKRCRARSGGWLAASC
jgi:hypothetical protein